MNTKLFLKAIVCFYTRSASKLDCTIKDDGQWKGRHSNRKISYFVLEIQTGRRSALAAWYCPPLSAHCSSQCNKWRLDGFAVAVPTSPTKKKNKRGYISHSKMTWMVVCTNVRILLLGLHTHTHGAEGDWESAPCNRTRLVRPPVRLNRADSEDAARYGFREGIKR